MKHGVIILVMAALGASFAPGPAAGADEGQLRREDQLKAAYLLNFIKFVEWPPAAAGSSGLSICFLAAPSVYAVFATGIENKRVGARAIIAQEVRGEQEMSGCDALYVSHREPRALQLMSPRHRTALLSVSDARDFARYGGIIELFTDDNRLKFMINVAAARRSGLRIGSALLQLATVVEEEGKP